jgi:tRNA(Ile)-lysidine synthase
MTWTLLHARLQQTLKQRQLLNKGNRVLVAVSGGQDSLCLLKLLLDLQPKWNWTLAIAHCDHCWSYDVGLADYVEKLAQKWEMPFYLKTATQLKETEAAAREWRYQALTEIASEYRFNRIVTGHTQSDRAETLLYNLIRGAGSDGLSSLTWRRFLTKEIELIRPLLKVSRLETGEFCQQLQLPVWEDSANENLKYARNRIRRDLLPYLKTHFNPQVEQALAHTAEILHDEIAYLETITEPILEQARKSDIRVLNRTCLQGIPLALQRLVVRQFLQKALKRTPNFEQIEELTHLINAPNRSRTSTLPGKEIAEVQGDWIRLLGSQS